MRVWDSPNEAKVDRLITLYCQTPARTYPFFILPSNVESWRNLDYHTAQILNWPTPFEKHSPKN
jgi:hypothetical protein